MTENEKDKRIKQATTLDDFRTPELLHYLWVNQIPYSPVWTRPSIKYQINAAKDPKVSQVQLDNSTTATISSHKCSLAKCIHVKCRHAKCDLYFNTKEREAHERQFHFNDSCWSVNPNACCSEIKSEYQNWKEVCHFCKLKCKNKNVLGKHAKKNCSKILAQTITPNLDHKSYQNGYHFGKLLSDVVIDFGIFFKHKN